MMSYRISFQQRLLNSEAKLNDTDDRITDYLICYQNDPRELTIKEICAHLFLSPNTITRYYQKLGYTGFSELKLALDPPKPPLEMNPLAADIDKTFQLVDNKREKQVIKILAQSKQNIFYGIGQSGWIAQTYGTKFNALNAKSKAIVYQHEVYREIDNVPHSSLFLISLSGETEQLVLAKKYAQERGGKVICLTNLKVNTLQKNADVSLYCYSSEKKLKGYTITSEIPVMIILESLFETYRKLLDV